MHTLFGLFSGHQGGIVGRHGHILPDIAGGYFTIALFATFFPETFFYCGLALPLKANRRRPRSG
jgi:hypothetical protein